MKTPAILFLLFFFSPLGLGAFFVCAQPTQPLLDSIALANAPEYKSIASALQAPDKDKVYKLNLNGQGLKELPAEVFLFRNLQVLDCSYNKLTSLPAKIGELINLTRLNCYSNQLTSLPATIGELKNLTYLDCFSNQLTSLPAEIGKLINLQVLILGVELYDERWNQLTSLPAEIGELKSLTYLDCSWNRLTSLPATIGELKNLTYLYCSYNQLTSLPATIGELKNLTYLSCASNQLTSLPATIGELKSLTFLSCSSNQLTSLPATIGELKSLTTLSCSFNQLTSLPAEIGELKSLTYLDCSFNQLTSLPASLGELQELSVLGCNYNPIETLPDDDVLLAKIQHITFGGKKNKLKALSPHVGKLISVEYLDVSYNELADFPTSVLGLPSLAQLRLTKNPFKSIPADIQKLQNLMELHLDSLEIESLPIEIQSLSKLKKLNLMGTEIKTPVDKRLYPFLKKFAFGGNVAIALQVGESLEEQTKNAEQAKAQADKFKQEAEDKTKNALTEKERADRSAEDARLGKRHAETAEEKAKKDKARAEQKEKEAKEAKKSAEASEKKATALSFWIAVIGIGILVIVLLFLAYFVASQRKAKAQARLIQAKQQETEEKNQELEAIAEELRQQSEMVQQQRDDLIKSNNEMEALTEELRQQAETLEATNAEMQAMQQTKDLMISAVNHDLRNPLNPILNYSKAGYQGDKDERLAIIHDRAKMMFSLIGDIMDVYRADKLTVTPAVANAHKAASEAIHVITDAKTDLPATVNEVPEGLEGLFEYKYIERVLENILSNAVKYSDKAEEGGKVVVGARLIEASEAILKNKDLATHHAQFVRVSIADNGMGIPKDQFEAIFEPFTNPNARSIGSAKSVGIGLTFCKTIVEAHGSLIQIASVVGEGTTFSFDLPYSPPKIIEVKKEEMQEESIIFEALTAEEKASLADTTALLGGLDLCTSEMEEAIQGIDTQGNANIEAWKRALAQANDDYEEDLFKKLLIC